MVGDALTAVLFQQLTGFASELGQVRADMAQLKITLTDYIAKVDSVDNTCRKLELLVISAISELRGRNAIADRASVTQVDVSGDGAQLVVKNDGEVSFQRTLEGVEINTPKGG